MNTAICKVASCAISVLAFVAVLSLYFSSFWRLCQCWNCSSQFAYWTPISKHHFWQKLRWWTTLTENSGTRHGFLQGFERLHPVHLSPILLPSWCPSAASYFLYLCLYLCLFLVGLIPSLSSELLLNSFSRRVHLGGGSFDNISLNHRNPQEKGSTCCV